MILKNDGLKMGESTAIGNEYFCLNEQICDAKCYSYIDRILGKVAIGCVRFHLMVNCPKCGTKATTIKCWTMASSKNGVKGTAPEIRIGIFKCTKCEFKFRAKVDSEVKKGDSEVEKVDSEGYSNLIEKLSEIKSGLNNNLSKLRENLKVIESERSGRILEAEELEDVEDKADELEGEVNDLRDELKSLKDLLGYKDDQNNL